MRVVVCSADALTDSPAGPALRALGLARGLRANGVDVLVAAPAGGDVALEQLGELVDAGAIVIASGFLLEQHPAIARARRVVIDAAGPFLVENLVIHQALDERRRRRILVDEAAVHVRALAAADLVLVAHERQRDLVTGMMLAGGASSPDELLAERFLTVPFGPTGPAGPAERTPAPGLRLVWPGGVWAWLDVATLVEAVAIARGRGVDVTAAIWGAGAELAGDGIEAVSWVPHSERSERLAWADAAVTLDPGGLEARYAFRTRLVDALAAGLPTIATAGEHVADTAAAAGAGFTIPPGDAGALARLLERLAGDETLLEHARARTVALAQGWAYEASCAPLAAWCHDGASCNERGRGTCDGSWSRSSSRRAWWRLPRRPR